jgi:GNAT superfamily N-acetyltransferase
VRVDADALRLVWELHTPTERVGYLDALDGESLWHLGVDPRHRYCGHATRLLRAVLTHARGCKQGWRLRRFPRRQPGLAHDALRAWQARHGFRPVPGLGDPYRMLRPAALTRPRGWGCGARSAGSAPGARARPATEGAAREAGLPPGARRCSVRGRRPRGCSAGVRGGVGAGPLRYAGSLTGTVMVA